ncbi:MAG: hypothetical protein QXI87_01515 [Thermoproteota archaeon]
MLNKAGRGFSQSCQASMRGFPLQRLKQYSRLRMFPGLSWRV